MMNYVSIRREKDGSINTVLFNCITPCHLNHGMNLQQLVDLDRDLSLARLGLVFYLIVTSCRQR